QDNLQEGFQVTDYTNYPGVSEIEGFGTHITGTNAIANGFDATQTGNASMYSWNPSTQQWNAIPNTNSKQLNTGEAYALMVRGGRELDLNLNNTQLGSATTLRFTGELVTGNFPVVSIAPNLGDFSLIANPYQAQVDIETLLFDADLIGINTSAVWIYDPNLGVHGGYAALDMQGPVFDPVPDGSLVTKFLQPNQSMFVQNALDGPVFTFKETHKKDSGKEFTNGTFSVNNTGTLNITLRRHHQSNYRLVDGVRLYFEESF
ncbi:hypothetical protein G3567_13235, partial [Psychroflexus sp. YR1-1]|nr:hypothetical protein [Psychroflexus aurantiacus]